MSNMKNIEAKLGNKHSNKQKTLTGYHVAAMMVAFFAVILAVNITMAWFASSSWTGLVVKNSYVASQQYNEKIEAARKQQALGWRLKFEYSDGLLSFYLVDDKNNPVIIENLTASIGRPVSQVDDISVNLVYIGQGRYQSKVSLPKGIWRFQLDDAAKSKYHAEGRFFVSLAGKGTLQ